MGRQAVVEVIGVSIGCLASYGRSYWGFQGSHGLKSVLTVCSGSYWGFKCSNRLQGKLLGVLNVFSEAAGEVVGFSRVSSWF